MKVGFIGLGIMGASMASNLMKAGHELVVHDIKRDAAAPHLKAGAVWADTPRQVAEATEVVLTSLPGPPEMESVALGENGLLSGMAKGKVYFDLTTNSPAVVRRGGARPPPKRGGPAPPPRGAGGGRGAAGALAGGAPGRGRPPAHLRPDPPPVLPRQVRPAELRAAPGPQG